MNFSQITDDLFIGTTPSVNDYNQLRSLGVRLVINMRYTSPPAHDSHSEPIPALWLPSIDSPFFPLSIPKLMLGVEAGLTTIQNGGKVFAHCAYGRHRGPAMGSCILIAQGMSPLAAMGLIKERRLFADPSVFYIRRRILRFAEEWKNT